MQIVKENGGPSILDEERERMERNMRGLGRSDGPKVPTRRPTIARTHSHNVSGGRAPQRGLVQRSDSTRSPLAPTKSTDMASSLRGNTLQRAKSSRLLVRHTSSRALGAAAIPPCRAPPDRISSVDSTNSLRAFRREQIMNTSIEPLAEGRIRGPGGTLHRNESDMSNFTTSDLSTFTMDSINIRKNQMIADPIDDATYDEAVSYADHESISRSSNFTEYPAERKVAAPSGSPTSTANEIRIEQMQIDGDCSDGDEDSFGSLGSALTGEFDEDFDDSDEEE